MHLLRESLHLLIEIANLFRYLKPISFLVSLIEHFQLLGLEIVTSCQQTFRVTRTVYVPSRLHITVTQVAVGIPVGACRVRDINVVSATECWSITVISVHGITRVFHVELEWFESITVLKRKNETPSRVCVRAT